MSTEQHFNRHTPSTRRTYTNLNVAIDQDATSFNIYATRTNTWAVVQEDTATVVTSKVSSWKIRDRIVPVYDYYGTGTGNATILYENPSADSMDEVVPRKTCHDFDLDTDSIRCTKKHITSSMDSERNLKWLI